MTPKIHPSHALRRMTNGTPQAFPLAWGEIPRSTDFVEILKNRAPRFRIPKCQCFAPILYFVYDPNFSQNIYVTKKIKENTQVFKENLGISSLHIEFWK